MQVGIHNQCSDLKLTDRRGLSSGANWNEEPDEEVDAGSMMSVGLIPLLAEFEGALTYVLQKEDVKPGKRPEPTHILLFVAWKSEGYKSFCVLVQLIECNKQPYWNEAKLQEYHQVCASQLCTYTDPIEDTWLIHDGTVLTTRLELDFTQRDGVLNIVISEGIRDDHTKRPEWINLKR
jgi:hypothetical protein